MSPLSMSTAMFMAQHRKPMPTRRMSRAVPGHAWRIVSRAPWALMRKHGDNRSHAMLRAGVLRCPPAMRQRLESRMRACFMRAAFLHATRSTASRMRNRRVDPMRKPAQLMRPKRARAQVHAARLDTVIKIVHVLGLRGVIVYKPGAWPTWRGRSWRVLPGAGMFEEVSHAS